MQKFLLAASATFILMVFFFAEGGYSRPSPTEFRLNIVQATPMPPPPTADEIARKKDVDLRWRIFWWGLLLTILVTGAGASFRFVIVPVWRGFTLIEPDEKGMFPLLRGKYRGRDADGHEVQYEYYHDQNASVTPGTVISKNGTVNIRPQLDGDIDMHAEYSAKQLGYLGMRAMSGGQGGRSRGMNKAETELVGGVVAHKAREAETKQQIAALRLEQMRQKALPEPESEEPTPAKTPTTDIAIATSSSTGFIVGYTDDGIMCKINLQSSIHCAIIGSTGTGKTSSIGMKMIVDSIRHGYHTVILDGMGGEDLGAFGDHAEWHDSTPRSFPGQLQALLSEHKRRMSLVSGGGKVDKSEKKSLQPIAVFIEEFNEIWANMASEDQESCEPILKTIMAKGRHTKIHMIVIGQETEEWPKTLLNIKARVIFALGLAEAQRIAEFHAVHLPDNGEFLFKNQQFKAWLWEEEYKRFLPANGGNRGVRLLEVENGGNVSETAETVEKRFEKRPETRVVTALSDFQARNGEGCTTPRKSPKGTPPQGVVSAVSAVPQPIMRLWSRTQDLESVGAKFFEIFPDGTQSDLRKTMSVLTGGNPNSYKKKAFTIYHSYSPHGNNYSKGK